MSIVDEPIHNLEQAKSYFIAMGCSHFHLSRETFQRRDEYYALNISSDIEKKWRQEEVEHRLAKFPFNEPEKIDFSYSSLKDMIECDSYNLERMLTLANDFCDILPPDQIPNVLNAIIGNNGSLTRGGLIEKACKIGLSDLAQRYIICAKNFIGKAEDNNISISFMRGYFVDVIKAFKLKEEETYLSLLREKDNIENIKYYKEGAEEGNVFSMRMLAEHYKEGKGCDIDSAKAKYWTQAAIMINNSCEQGELDNLSHEDTDYEFEKHLHSKRNSVIKVTLGLIINPRKTLVEIKNQKSYLPGIILGVIVTLSFPLMSLIGRILMGMSNYTDISKTLAIAPVFGILFFVLCVSCVYLLCRLFKGEGKYLSLASNMGWASIPEIFISITFVLLIVANTLMQAFPGYKSAILLTAVICAFLMIAEFIWSIKTAVISLSVSMNLNLIKSIVVFIISSIIYFIPFNYLSKALAIGSFIK